MSGEQSFGLHAGEKVHGPGKRNHKKSSRQTGHTKTCMWINTQIISSSQAGSSVDGLALMISEHLHNMNLVNLTTAIHRLAKMVAHDAKLQARLKESSVLAKILPAIARLLSTTHSNNIQSQSLCNILWSLATIRIVDTHVISLVCGHTLPNMFSFKPFELALLLWALAKLSTVESISSFGTIPLKDVFDSASNYLAEHARSMECRCLSMVVWSYATAKQFDAELFALVATQVANGPTPSCQEMANTIWAFGTQSITNLELFKFLAQKGIDHVVDFKAQELSNMLWGFASSGYFHEQFYQRAAEVALSKDLSTQHLANIIWSFSRVRANHHLTQRVILNLLPTCIQQMRNFKIQEVSSVTLSVAKAFVGSDPYSLPSMILDFFQSISRIRYRPADFSTHSLINMASAIAMLQLFDNELLVQLGREAVARAPLIEASDLFRIFQVFLSAQVESPGCAYIAGLLVSPLADRLKSLRPREVKSLSHSCCEFLREANRQDLLDHCSKITERICSDACSESSDARHARDMSSGAETDEPENSMSEFSDSAVEDADRNMFASDAKWNANQQVADAYVTTIIPTMNGDYFFVPMPVQQSFWGGNFDWSQQQQQQQQQEQQHQLQQQQPSWWSEQGFKDIPIDHDSNVEIGGFTSATLSNKSSHPVPPPSSLLWDVGITSGSPSLSAAQDESVTRADLSLNVDRVSIPASLLAKTLVGSLQMADSGDCLCMDRVKTRQTQGEVVDSTYSVVVKNTFIEYQASNCISSVHFCSEQIGRRGAAKDKALNSNSRLAELLVPGDEDDTDDGF